MTNMTNVKSQQLLTEIKQQRFKKKSDLDRSPSDETGNFQHRALLNDRSVRLSFTLGCTVMCVCVCVCVCGGGGGGLAAPLYCQESIIFAKRSQSLSFLHRSSRVIHHKV